MRVTPAYYFMCISLIGYNVTEIGEKLTNIVLSWLPPIGGGTIASLIVIVIWECYKQPKLVIEIPERSEKEPTIQPLNQTSRAFYHLTVKNTGRSPAYHCSIRMKFSDANSEKQPFEINGKWDHAPEPFIRSLVPTKVLPNGEIENIDGEIRQDFLIPFAEVIDIYPAASEDFCIVFKSDNEEECYAFGSRGYIKSRDHKVKEWKLDVGEYIVEIEITYSGKKLTKEKFLVITKDKKIDSVTIKKVDK